MSLCGCVCMRVWFVSILLAILTERMPQVTNQLIQVSLSTSSILESSTASVVTATATTSHQHQHHRRIPLFHPIEIQFELTSLSLPLVTATFALWLNVSSLTSIASIVVYRP